DDRLDRPCLRGDLGKRLDAGDDAGLRDAGLGLAASSQMVAGAPGQVAVMKQFDVAPKATWTGGLPGVKAPDALILPDPATRFSRTAARLDFLSAGHPMEEWLGFMARAGEGKKAVAG